jgi:hypothetical protein
MSQNDEDFWKIVAPLESGQKQRRRVRTRRRKWGTGRKVAVLVSVVLLLAGVVAGINYIVDTFTADRLTPAAAPAAPVPAATPTRRIMGPFEGSPAANYAEGAAGVVMPRATKIAEWSAADVGRDLAAVKSALIASHLDHRVLVSRDTSAFLAMLAPADRSQVRKDFANPKTRGYVVEIAPGTKLLPDQPRVAGKTTIAAASDQGGRHLEIVTNYVWVYPFDAPTAMDDQRQVVVHDEIHWRFFRPGRVIRDDLGLWAGAYRSYAFKMDCALLDKGLIAPANPSVVGGGPAMAPGDEGNRYYDPNHSLDVPNGCGPI